jgi:hypothetical protein
LDQSKVDGAPALTRRVTLTLPVADGDWRVRTSTLRIGGGDILAAAAALGIGDWPTNKADWDALAADSTLPINETPARAESGGGVEVDLVLEMPSVMLVELLRCS